MHSQMQQCIEDCLRCSTLCIETRLYCIEKGGHLAEPSFIRMLQDCAEICKLNADFLKRSSEWHSRTCSVTAEICEQISFDSERIGPDPQLLACAKICMQCTDSCRQISEIEAA